MKSDRHDGSDTMPRKQKLRRAARADCATRKDGVKMHGLERSMQVAKTPRHRRSIQGPLSDLR